MAARPTSSGDRETPPLGNPPNVLWVFVDDISPWLPSYGDDTIETEHISGLAERGTRFERLYSTAPVCTPSRSAVVTGMYQTTIGAHNHYSSFETWRGIEMERWAPNHLGVRTIPEIFKSGGYYTFNEGKNHYDFVDPDHLLYDRHGEAHSFQGATDGSEWSGRDPDQPFFGQVQLPGGKSSVREEIDRVDPADVQVPPYYPDHPIIREEIAHHYDTLQETDRRLGEILDGLERDGLAEETIVWFFADHGMTLPRHKQFCYQGGIHVPGVVAGPGVPNGEDYPGLVSGIDIPATTLALAGFDVPDHMHGENAFSPDFNREYVIAARDRCDYTIDRIRAVVTEEYSYLRNFMTDRPYLQPQFRDGREYLEVLRDLHEAGELNEVQSRFVSDQRPAEELYHLPSDPHETENLVHATDRDHREALAELRTILHRWIVETDDKGRFPESEDGLRAALTRWEDEAVDPLYDEVR